jgi:hypothetical protein
MRSVFATVEDIHYFADVGDARTRALFDRARVGGQALERRCGFSSTSASRSRRSRSSFGRFRGWRA